MRVHFTLQNFPATGSLRNQCGLPFACVVQPLAQPSQPGAPATVNAEDVTRCGKCYAYINKYCSFQAEGWTCALCGHFNQLKGSQDSRYARPQSRAQLPELQGDLYEVECTLDGDANSLQVSAGEGGLLEEETQPAFLALVDLCCCEEVLELARSALAAALEALPPAARFGLITFFSKVGLWDVRGKLPVVRWVPMVEDGRGSPTPLDLQDALPLDALLAPAAACKEAITAAIDALQPAQPPATAASLELTGGQAVAGRAFGSALQAVLRYLGSAATPLQEANGPPAAAPPAAAPSPAPASSFAGARLLVFLAGAPDSGRGAVVQLAEQAAAAAGPSTPLPPSGASEASLRGSRPATPLHSAHSSAADVPALAAAESSARRAAGARAFYEEAAAAAAALQVCVDVFAVSPAYCGLDALEPLAGGSGGCLFLYPSPDQAALPQDVYRRLATPLARAGLLRLRASQGLRARAAYGQLFPDVTYPDLKHVAACSPATAFAFDLEHEGAASLAPDPEDRPLLQIAFRYDLASPCGSKQQPRHVRRRRLRVLTLPAAVGRTPAEVYAGADLDAVLALLTHKVARAAAAGQGAPAARALLRDWLRLFLSRYNSHLAQRTGAPPMLTASQVDTTLENAGNLAPLPGLVHALLRSPLLTTQPPSHPDARAAADHLWGGLPPDQLRCAVYPVLASYSDPETLARPAHPLSRAALITAGAPIFLLDRGSEVLIYYVVGFPPHIPFPPPQQSALRRRAAAARASRLPTPALRLLKGGEHDVRPVLDCLLEEPEPGRGPDAPPLPGLAEWLEGLRADVWDSMIASASTR